MADIRFDQVETGKLIKARREFLGLSLNKAAQRMGVPATTLKRWEDGTVKNVKISAVKKAAEALETTPENILGYSIKVVTPNGLEPIPEMNTCPIIGEIACGQPILAQENYAGEANLPSNITADFALRVKGDSMINARIYDGDLVFIRLQSDVENGEIAAVLIDDEVTLKRVYKYEGRLELRPENPMYKPINIEGPNLLSTHIIGKPVAFIGTII